MLIAKHSRVNRSMTVSARKRRPPARPMVSVTLARRGAAASAAPHVAARERHAAGEVVGDVVVRTRAEAVTVGVRQGLLVL